MAAGELVWEVTHRSPEDHDPQRLIPSGARGNQGDPGRSEPRLQQVPAMRRGLEPAFDDLDSLELAGRDRFPDEHPGVPLSLYTIDGL